MKKIIALVLCAVMLVGTMSVLAFAEDDLAYIDARDLREYGQKHFYIGDADETAPDVEDGKVIPGEYTLGPITTTIEEDYIGPEQGTGETLQITKIDYYFSYDDTYLYIAAEVYDEENVLYNTWPDAKTRCDYFTLIMGGFEDTGSTETLASKFGISFYSGCEASQLRGTVSDYNSVGNFISGSGLFDPTTVIDNFSYGRDETRKVSTLEVAYNREAIKNLFAANSTWEQRDDIFSLNFWIQDTTKAEIEEGGVTKGTKSGIYNWGTPVDLENNPYDAVNEYWLYPGSGPKTLDASSGAGKGSLIIPHMLFLGNEEDFAALLAGEVTYDDETDPDETDPVETDPVDTDPVDTDPVDTDPVDTDPVDTDPVDTDPVDTTDDKKGGCGSSIAAMGIALVATLGTCAVFVSKKND